ncbi:hypothetical protein C0993_003538, partial [Termitomyces sp. T159_Od127]
RQRIRLRHFIRLLTFVSLQQNSNYFTVVVLVNFCYISMSTTRSTRNEPNTQSTTGVEPEFPAPLPDSPEDGLLPNARIVGPIPDDFDFEGRISLPDGITSFELPLAVRIRENADIEEFNNNSILKTIAVKNTPVPRPADMDIGPPLKPSYYYADEDTATRENERGRTPGLQR